MGGKYACIHVCDKQERGVLRWKLSINLQDILPYQTPVCLKQKTDARWSQAYAKISPTRPPVPPPGATVTTASGGREGNREKKILGVGLMSTTNGKSKRVVTVRGDIRGSRWR